jgi:hypothetical protein
MRAVPFSISATLATALCLASLPARAQPFSDNFSGKTLNPGWTVASPNPDSSYGLTGKGDFNLTASPLNGGSDLYPTTNYNAPVLLQPVPATDNWTISTELLLQPTNNYQSAGMLLATQPGFFTDVSQFLRVAEHVFYPPQFPSGEGVCVSGTCFAYSSQIVYFRVTKSGSAKKGYSYQAAYSPDGKTWTKGAKIASTIPYTYFGLHSIRYVNDGDYNLYTAANFNYFHVKLKHAE